MSKKQKYSLREDYKCCAHCEHFGFTNTKSGACKTCQSLSNFTQKIYNISLNVFSDKIMEEKK